LPYLPPAASPTQLSPIEQTRTVTREKKGGGVAIIKVKRTKDDVSRASILKVPVVSNTFATSIK